MRKETVIRKNYDFLLLEIIPFLKSVAFQRTLKESFEHPIKKEFSNTIPGCLIISNYLTKDFSEIFIQSLDNKSTLKLSQALEDEITQEGFSNEATIEANHFNFKFKIMKYEVPSRPNLPWVTVQDLGEIYGAETIWPIADLKIIFS